MKGTAMQHLLLEINSQTYNMDIESQTPGAGGGSGVDDNDNDSNECKNLQKSEDSTGSKDTKMLKFNEDIVMACTGSVMYCDPVYFSGLDLCGL